MTQRILPAIGAASFLAAIGLVAMPVAAAPPATAASPTPDSAVLFETHVRPILKAHCFHCHGDEEQPKAGLDLRLARLIAQGGESGPAVAAGNPKNSAIYQRVAADEMPPGKKKLGAGEKETLRKWIEQGARTARAEPAKLPAGPVWTDEERQFWSLQPVKRPPLPKVQRRELLRTPIDAFLLAALEAKGLSYSPPADRRTLIRRLSLDLTGLPPTPERAEQFDSDTRPDAYERLVDELLASPAYGERWARHWLDVAGYADSDGYTEKDPVRPWAFRFRDYVIRSLNGDMPWDQFLVEQLAGDELLAPPYQNLSPDDADKLAATGFLRMAPDGTSDGGVDQMVARNDVVAETLKIVSTSLLGLTVGCAQCHDHRYDPISQLDYYRLRAVFEPALSPKNWRPPAARLVNLWTPAEHEAAAKVDAEIRGHTAQRLADLDRLIEEIFAAELKKLDEKRQAVAQAARKTPPDKRTPEQKQILKDLPSLNVDRGSAILYRPARVRELDQRLEKQTAESRAKRPGESFIACLTEVPGQAPPTHLFYRGDLQQPRQQVAPGDLSVLGDLAVSIPADNPQLPTTGRRLALARHLTSGRHPLTARVLVNRIWMHHFGRGLSPTPSDFGHLGQQPSHPELLDWLADEFVRGGWQLKTLQRLIVTSTVYRQSAVRSNALRAVDPDNRLLGRMPVRRLETEAIRDSILAVSGGRVTRMFGPPIVVNPDDVGQVVIGKATRDGNGIMIAQTEQSDDLYRPTIYVQVRRSMPLGMLEPFDVAATAPNCELRTSTTAASQSLLMLNGDDIVRLAGQFAERVIADAGSDLAGSNAAAQVRRAWLLAYGRAPSAEEASDAVAFVTSQEKQFAAQQAATSSAAQSPPSKPAAKSIAKTPAPTASPRSLALTQLCQALLCSNRFLYID